MSELRTNTAFMNFWDAINQARAASGQAEMVYANACAVWEKAIEPTHAEKVIARRRARKYQADLAAFQARHPEWSAEQAKDSFDRLFAL